MTTGFAMPRYLLHHHHLPRECGAVFASFTGHESPLRRTPTTASCPFGGHEIWWEVTADSEQAALALLPILGFFTKGVFGGFPLYFPELYPTRLRSTGAGFCYNAGRIVASASPFLTGALVSTFGSFGLAASAVAAIYVAGLVILPFAIETSNRPLSD